ncbi:MAG: heparinase II/III family protein [Chloroflexi bacterium]|nr:heparinase II/III family protein [Chloroflexota bacterium]
MRPSVQQLKQWFADPAPLSNLRQQIRTAPMTAPMLEVMRAMVPDVTTIPLLTYHLYREFEHTGSRPEFQDPYFLRRAMLTRALVEYIMGDSSMLRPIENLLWAICEETSWVVPAHEEQGPNYWEVEPPILRTEPLGAHTALTREPDSIDLFAAETGAVLAETAYLLKDDLTPEVYQRVKQELERHIFKPYLAHARKHWWFKGALNWNGVCNGSIGLAFLRMVDDPQTLAEAFAMVLEGFETYIATGFEADGGSIEGVGYWNYGLMFYVTVAELLRELTKGELDLLAADRMKDIAYYPVGMALQPPQYLNFGDTPETVNIAAGIAQKLAERTGVHELRALVGSLPKPDEQSYSVAKLPIMLRQLVWWDGQAYDPPALRDYYLPTVGVVKMVGKAAAQPVVLAVTVGHNDGHHSHVDVGSFVYHINGESLIPDAGRGKYSKAYFRQTRYDNIFTNAYSHNIPRISGKMQQPGREFGGERRFYGTIVDHGEDDGWKFVTLDFHTAYDLPELTLARRTVSLDPKTGVAIIQDQFEFAADPLPIEEAFVTWHDVTSQSADTVLIRGEQAAIKVCAEGAGANFQVEFLEQASRENERRGVLKRISTLITGTTFTLVVTPEA